MMTLNSTDGMSFIDGNFSFLPVGSEKNSSSLCRLMTGNGVVVAFSIIAAYGKIALSVDFVWRTGLL
jgi:hypothetical protein